MGELSQTFFDNEKEKIQIEIEIMKAIPEDVKIMNIIRALNKLLTTYTEHCFENEIHGEEDAS